MATIVLLVILAAIVLWVIGAYNALIALKNQVANAWTQIDVQLKRRHDLIPNLVDTVKGATDRAGDAGSCDPARARRIAKGMHRPPSRKASRLRRWVACCGGRGVS